MIRPQWGEQQQDKKYAAAKDELPVFFYKQLKIHESEKEIDNGTQQNGCTLSYNCSVIITIAGGRKNQSDSKSTGQ